MLRSLPMPTPGRRASEWAILFALRRIISDLQLAGVGKVRRDVHHDIGHVFGEVPRDNARRSALRAERDRWDTCSVTPLKDALRLLDLHLRGRQRRVTRESTDREERTVVELFCATARAADAGRQVDEVDADDGGTLAGPWLLDLDDRLTLLRSERGKERSEGLSAHRVLACPRGETRRDVARTAHGRLLEWTWRPDWFGPLHRTRREPELFTPPSRVRVHAAGTRGRTRSLSSTSR